MNAIDYSRLHEELTPIEMLQGMLLYFKGGFSDQALYTFLYNLEEYAPGIREALQIYPAEDGLRSSLLPEMLSILIQGKALRVDAPNPVEQYFRVRESHHASLKELLTTEGILPKYDSALSNLARDFQAHITPIVSESIAR